MFTSLNVLRTFWLFFCFSFSPRRTVFYFFSVLSAPGRSSLFFHSVSDTCRDFLQLVPFQGGISYFVSGCTELLLVLTRGQNPEGSNPLICWTVHWLSQRRCRTKQNKKKAARHISCCCLKGVEGQDFFLNICTSLTKQ